MGKYILSEYFTLIPKEVYSKELAQRALSGQFSLTAPFSVGSFHMEKENAVVAYVQDGNPEDESLPFVLKLLEEATQVVAYNKVAFHYSHEKKLAHVVIYTGDELKLANSFKADSFESALYFLFLSIKGLQMNPRQCEVMACWQTSREQEDVFTRFFCGFKTNDLNTLL